MAERSPYHEGEFGKCIEIRSRQWHYFMQGVSQRSNRKRITLHKLLYRKNQEKQKMTIEETVEQLKGTDSQAVEIKLDINTFKLKPKDE